MMANTLTQPTPNNARQILSDRNEKKAVTARRMEFDTHDFHQFTLRLVWVERWKVRVTGSVAKYCESKIHATN